MSDRFFIMFEADVFKESIVSNTYRKSDYEAFEEGLKDDKLQTSPANNEVEFIENLNKIHSWLEEKITNITSTREVPTQ